jgi:hypothetical protein
MFETKKPVRILCIVAGDEICHKTLLCNTKHFCIVDSVMKLNSIYSNNNDDYYNKDTDNVLLCFHFRMVMRTGYKVALYVHWE